MRTYLAIIPVLFALTGVAHVLSKSADAPMPEVAGMAVVQEVQNGPITYTNATYKFQLQHPKDLVVSEFREGGGASTITFQNHTTAEGFQIFITPYAEPQVTPERFRMDNPGAARSELKDVTIDGALGASFFSTHEFLGDTAEVWFVYNGFLYEVTTLKSLSGWISDILSTWKFTV